MAKVTLEDGTQVDVPVDSIQFDENESPQGFIPTARMQDEVKRRVTSAKKNARNELAADDEFVRELIEGRGGELREDGTIKGAAKDVRQLEDQWKAKHLMPLQQKIDDSSKQIERFRTKALEADVLQAAAEAGVKPAFLKPLTDNAEAPIVTMLKSSFAYDSDTDRWGLKEGDSFKYGPDGRPAGAKHLIESLKANESYAEYFQPVKLKGSNYQGNDSTSNNRKFTPEQIAAMTDAEYEANREAILKGGLS